MASFVQASRRDGVKVTNCCAQKPYLELRLPGDAVSIQKITVTLSSRDQGWCGDPGLVGKEGFTWFELNVETSGGRNHVPPRCIHRNPAGVSNWSNNQIVLKSAHECDEGWAFAANIRPYDIVKLVPRAQFDGWTNFVRRAELKIEYNSHLPENNENFESTLRYSKLVRGELSEPIRLLNLLPGEKGDPVVVALTTSDLVPGQADSRRVMPHYEALSYCWGKTEKKSMALLRVLDEDRSTNVAYVSGNLYKALQHLRKPIEKRPLWIDQICINQRDQEELSNQVQIMGLIYGQAARVIVWLGEGDPELERSIDEVNKLFPHFQQPTAEQLRLGTFRGHLPNVTDKTLPLSEVSCLLSLPWFWRVWVVQEAVLAKERILMYGQRTLDWEVVQNANMWTKFEGFELPGQPHVVLPSIWSCMAIEKQTGTETSAMTRPGYDLLTRVIRGLDLRASDPRDHIFGLYGLCDEVRREGRSALLIVPDYNKSISEAFSDFTSHYAKQDLRILSAVHALRGRTWRSLGNSLAFAMPASPHSKPREPPPAYHPTWALWYDGSTEWANETLGLSGMYLVTGDSELQQPVLLGENRKQLNLSGHRLGRLKNIEAYHRPADLTSDTSLAFTRLFNKSTDRQFNEFSGLGDPHQRKPAPHDPGRHWHAHMGGHGVPSFIPCANDCYFRATNDLSGLCPSGTRVGDVVVILYGGPVPYLIRETETAGQYTFVGECFLEGKMDQNLLLPFQESGTEPETFVLA